MATKVGAFGYKLYVGNLPWTVASRQLREYFSQFGHISRAIVVFDKDTGMSKGFGFVTFTAQNSVQLVQGKSNHVLERHTLNIGTVDVPQHLE